MEWDEYFYNICSVVASNSKCLSRKIGSILVCDKRVVSVGYNGPPSGVPHCGVRHKYDLKLLSEYKRIDSYVTANCSSFNSEVEVTKCPRQIMGFKSGQGLEWCIASHSEVNALINAARNGICTKNTKLFMSCGIPCSKCLAYIINAGVEEIIVTKIEYYDESAEYVLKNSNLKYRVYSHLKKKGL